MLWYMVLKSCNKTPYIGLNVSYLKFVKQNKHKQTKTKNKNKNKTNKQTKSTGKTSCLNTVLIPQGFRGCTKL